MLSPFCGRWSLREERCQRQRPPGRADNALCVQLVATSKLPTRFGTFTLYGFFDSRENKEHTAIVQGDVAGRERVHSECHTGDVWGSLRCDCRDQLEAAVRHIAGQPFGAVVYMKQEDRGIGLLNKIKAEGIDVVDRIPVVIPSTAFDEGYLDVKKNKMGHML
jgi:GTP cyclohydrolase II